MSLKFSGLKELEKSYRQVAQIMGRAEARAVSRVATTIVGRQSRIMADTVNLRIGAIKKQIITRTKPTADQPRVVFEVRSKGVPLNQFLGTRQTKKGLSVQVLKGQPRALLHAAFLLRSGGAVGRASKVGTRYGSPHVGRLPIVKLFGPNVLSQYVKPAVQKAGADTWRERIPVELERESTFALQKAGLL